jgi:hypothetical protein
MNAAHHSEDPRPVFGPVVCVVCGKVFTPGGAGAKYCSKECKEQPRWDLKERVIKAYSDGKCSRCGFDDLRALCIHHVDGDGKDDRSHRNMLYRALEAADYPKEKNLVVLCANCHFIVHCNHKTPIKVIP